MAKDDQSTLVEKIITRMKNNPVLASVIVLGIIIIAVSTFTDAVRNLTTFLSENKRSSAANIKGKWTSSVLANPFDKNDTYRIVFEFNVKGNMVFGTLREISTKKRYDAINSILDGKITDNIISFHVQKTSTFGNETVRYRDLFYGTVSENEIDFVLQSDRPWGFPPQSFVAKRK
jgi:hypothetical protein